MLQTSVTTIITPIIWMMYIVVTTIVTPGIWMMYTVVTIVVTPVYSPMSWIDIYTHIWD